MIWGLMNKETYELATDKKGQAMVFLARQKARDVKKKMKKGEEYKLVNLFIEIDEKDYKKLAEK